jgi:hypothetical protein
MVSDKNDFHVSYQNQLKSNKNPYQKFAHRDVILANSYVFHHIRKQKTRKTLENLCFH